MFPLVWWSAALHASLAAARVASVPHHLSLSVGLPGVLKSWQLRPPEPVSQGRELAREKGSQSLFYPDLGKDIPSLLPYCWSQRPPWKSEGGKDRKVWAPGGRLAGAIWSLGHPSLPGKRRNTPERGKARSTLSRGTPLASVPWVTGRNPVDASGISPV